jgi:hypothetical protein
MSKQVSIRITDEMARKLVAIAKKRRVSFGSVSYCAIEYALNSDEFPSKVYRRNRGRPRSPEANIKLSKSDIKLLLGNGYTMQMILNMEDSEIDDLLSVYRSMSDQNDDK